MAVIEIKSEVPEGVYVMDVEDVEGASLGISSAKGSALVAARKSSPILPLSRYTQAMCRDPC